MILQKKFFLCLALIALVASILGCKLAKLSALPTSTPIFIYIIITPTSPNPGALPSPGVASTPTPGVASTSMPGIPSTSMPGSVATQVIQPSITVAGDGSIVRELTEQQLTTFAAKQLQQQGEFGVENIQVLLRDGIMKITGDAGLPLTIAIQITTDGQGNLQSKVVNAAIGPIPLPQDVTGQIPTLLNQMLLSQIGPEGQNYYFVDSVNIANGKLTLVAHKR